MVLFGCNSSSINPIKSIPMNNEECKVWSQIVSV